MRKPDFVYAKTKTKAQITTQLISTFAVKMAICLNVQNFKFKLIFMTEQAGFRLTRDRFSHPKLMYNLIETDTRIYIVTIRVTRLHPAECL